MPRHLRAFMRLGPVVAVALVGLFLGRGEIQAVDFTPTAEWELSDPVAGANTDITITTDFPEDQYIFSSLLTFTPGPFGLAACPVNDPGAATVACADDSVPDGAIVGTNTSEAVIGLINGPCVSSVTPTFVLMDASTDITNTVKFEDMDGNGIGEQFEDDDGDGIKNGVEMYPEYLTRLLANIPFGLPQSTPLQPIQRLYGEAVVGGEDTSLQFVVFPPGIMIDGSQMDPASGFLSVTVIQNTGDPGRIPSSSGVTDFCAPIHSVSTTYGITRDNPATGGVDEGGLPYLTNPGASAVPYIFAAALVSEYDEDEDGFENAIDTCPFNGNSPGWDPRSETSTGDSDGDGIPDICDIITNPGVDDQDGDGFMNREDNCPTRSNEGQLDPDRDDLGNECEDVNETNPALPEGHQDIVQTGAPAFIGPAHQGDADCGGTVTAVDALFTLKYVAGIQPTAACVNVGADANCDGNINAVDSLAMLRFVVGLPVNQQPPCTVMEGELP
jgi:hypothetical protein